MKRAGRALKRFGVVDFATTIAPGMRDVLLTGKVKEAVTRSAKRDRNKLIYDAVVMDAPPTGRITRFLNVTAEVRELARTGPVRGQAESVVALLKSKQTAVHVVTILEEMPVQETVDGAAELRGAELPVGAVIVNMARTPLLDAAGAEGCAGRKARRGPDRRRAEASVVQGEGQPGGGDGRARRPSTPSGSRWRRASARTWRPLGLPVVELPLLQDAVDLGGLYRLAEVPARAGDDRMSSPRPSRGSTSMPCSTTPGSSCAAAPAASGRRPRPRRWRCAPPSAGDRSSCSPSIRPAGSRSRWG